MKDKLNVNVVDIKKEDFKDIILSPGEDVYIKNVTSKYILVHVTSDISISHSMECLKKLNEED